MTNTKTLRLSVGALFTKGPGKIYFYRYQVAGRRKTVSLHTNNRAEALKKAQELIPIVKASTPEIVAAHVEYAKGFKEAERNLCVSDIWEYYSHHPERAIPATVNERLQYQASLQEFLDFLNNPSREVRSITPQVAEEFSEHLKTTGIAVHTHNRKLKRIRKIFSVLTDFYTGENPFRTSLFRREREEQNLGVRRLAFSREQEQKILQVLDDPGFRVINKAEIRVIYHLGMYTGQRLKDCVLLKWQSIDMERRRIWVKQFKTGKEVTIPVADQLLAVLREAEKWRRDDFVCPLTAERYNHCDKNGKNIGNNLVNLDVLRVIRWIGVEPSVAVPGRKRKMTQYGFHSLRHTFASHCAEAGVPKAVLLSILGTDSEIADKYYTHIGEEAQLKAIEAVTGHETFSASERINRALAYLATLPDSTERKRLEELLKFA
ncbi:MAG: tyrosine-type recombinase/integrase [Lentisphaeria bacterium]|nr:tyrosine-type recombinase/integrase [Lentisphaeria bacterium]